MKSFIELFIDARAVSTPLVAVRTFDPASTIRNVRKALDLRHSQDKDYPGADDTPIIGWDAIHGLKGLDRDADHTTGSVALQTMLTLADVPAAATVDLSVALGVLEFAAQDVIAFVHNPQLAWPTDPKVVQGVWNLRDGYKANGNMLVTLIGVGDTLPTELQQDVLVLDEPLPTAAELQTIITDTFKYAGQQYPACKGAAKAEVVKQATEALVGLPAFPAEQATAMCLDKNTGKLDIPQLWDRKRTIVSQRPGLTFLQPTETLADMYGNEGFANFAKAFMEGEYAPNIILRTDEIEKQFAGNGTDSSGSTGKQLGEFLSWIEDNNVVCTLALGVPGTSKSWSVQCIAGHYKKPYIKFDLSAMEDKHVGEGGKILRGNEKTVEAISDKKIWLIATANSLRGLPPELMSRFQVGGIFFFDVATEEEKLGIMKLKIARYKLNSEQPMPAMEGWSGRDINNCARRSQMLGIPLEAAGKLIIPLMTSHHEEMEALRASAHGKFLSASHSGVYQYKAMEKTNPNVITPVVNAGRKIR